MYLLISGAIPKKPSGLCVEMKTGRRDSTTTSKDVPSDIRYSKHMYNTYIPTISETMNLSYTVVRFL